MSTVTVTNGATYNVSSGQTDTSDTVNFGGTLNVLSGGTISNTGTPAPSTFPPAARRSAPS